MLTVFGYTEPLSVSPGETLHVMVSSESGDASYRADLVRLFCTDDHPLGPGFREVEIDCDANRWYPSRHQQTRAGSYVRVPPSASLDSLQSFSVSVLVWATRPGRRLEGLLTRWNEDEQRGFALCLDAHGCPALILGDGEPGHLSTQTPLIPREWYFVTASFDAATTVTTLHQAPLDPLPHTDKAVTIRRTMELTPMHHGLSLLIAAMDEGAQKRGHFNGKLECPRLLRSAPGELRLDQSFCAEDVVGDWDFSKAIDTDRIVDGSASQNHGLTVNLPTRGVTGHAWTGEYFDWQQGPPHYAAIHFHEDDLYDAGWQTDFTVTLPAETPSGVYAIRLRDSINEDHIPFFVRPEAERASIVFLVPTATYMAYANNHAAYTEPLDEMEWGALTEVQPSDVYLSGHYELGLSTYDTHRDASGVPYSSRRRPILTMRPRSRLWNFNADMHLIDWLDRQGFSVDVITDEDLDREGPRALEPYAVLLTGTHPEYYSHTMLNAINTFTRGGGRLMYLGGNGFYWRISYHPTMVGVIECRKSEGGVPGRPHRASVTTALPVSRVVSGVSWVVHPRVWSGLAPLHSGSKAADGTKGHPEALTPEPSSFSLA